MDAIRWQEYVLYSLEYLIERLTSAFPPPTHAAFPPYVLIIWYLKNDRSYMQAIDYSEYKKVHTKWTLKDFAH